MWVLGWLFLDFFLVRVVLWFGSVELKRKLKGSLRIALAKG